MTAEAATLVTGGNRGIGHEVCRQLAAQGRPVLLAARNADAAAQAAQTLRDEGGGHTAVTPVGLDVGDPASIAALAESLRARGQPLAALVNNAGVALDGFDAEVVAQTLAVNVQGPLHLTDAVRPFLAPAAPVVMVSSGMGAVSILSPALRAKLLADGLTRADLLGLASRFQENVAASQEQAAGWPRSAYSVSKALLNGLVRALSQEPAMAALRINAVCPGWVRTRMGGQGADRDVATGARGIVWAATLPPDGPRGGFFRDGKAIGW